MDNTEATPPVAGESVTTARGVSRTDWSSLQQDYERLGSFKAVAEEYGVYPSDVSHKAKELGVESIRRWRKRNFTPEQLLKLYEDGASIEDIAIKIRSSYSTAYGLLKSAGAKFQPGTKGWKWDDNAREKRQLAAERGVFKGTKREHFQKLGKTRVKENSLAERLLQQALMKARLSFETQSQELGRYWPDIKLHQRPVLIEADSWGHAMAHHVESDKKRDELLTKAGFIVIRFTNEQLESDADSCVAELIAQFNFEPEANPVFVIRDKREYKPGPLFN